MRIEAVLGRQDPGSEGVLDVAGLNGDGRLGNDGPVIHGGAHEMDRAAADLGPRFQNPGVGMQAFEGGEKRGVDVEMAVQPAGQ